jgi:hypothetical protein
MINFSGHNSLKRQKRQVSEVELCCKNIANKFGSSKLHFLMKLSSLYGTDDTGSQTFRYFAL